jgi:Ser/Thr protein kinase RdoA (MazF antagonist)
VTLVAVIGKLYARQVLAERLYRTTAALLDGPFRDSAPLCVPAPKMLRRDIGLVLQENVRGTDLQHHLSAENANAFALTGQWLAKLHTAVALTHLKETILTHELAKVARWCEYIASHFSTADPCMRQLDQTQRALSRIARVMPDYEPVMIHKDFYHCNILWDGTRLWGLDFDEISHGDAALDVAHFLAQLEALGEITGQAVASASRQFLHSYQERTTFSLDLRLPFYKSCAFIKVAANRARRKRPNWRRVVEAICGLAYREVDLGRSAVI